MKYEIVNGRVCTRSLEVHVVDHCNLRCRQCCSVSPYLKPWYMEPPSLENDLSLAGKALSPQYLKLVGGEPLLHPRLVDLLEIARSSGIAPIVSVTTNGLLLHKMGDEFWQLLDHMTLSIYPSPRLNDRERQRIRAKCTEFGVELNIKVQDEFQEMRLLEARKDRAKTLEIFGSCWLRRRCHMLRDGFFYTCTLPPHFQTYFQGRGPFARQDGVELRDTPSLAQEICHYLERSEPLSSCSYCWGGSGQKFPHRQLSSKEIAQGFDGAP